MSFCYKILESAWNYKLQFLEVSTIGVIVDGITDFNFFADQFKFSLNFKKKLIRLTETSSLLIIDTNYKVFEQFERLFEESNYKVYTLFIKNSFISQYLSYDIDNNIFEDDMFYLYIRSTNFSPNNPNFKNFSYIKISSLLSPFYIYKFNTYSELLEAYSSIIKNQSLWPIFALSTTINEKLKPPKNSNKIKENNILIANQSTTKCPLFSPEKNLFYVSFIEEKIERSQRLKNIQNMFSINEIDDIQISHLYQESDFQTIRTFLGFESEFRCLHVYDYLIYIEKKFNSIFDVILINQTKSFNYKINFSLYYIEVPNEEGISFDCSLIYSINYVDFFENSSFFYGFDNNEDFEYALNILSSNFNSKLPVLEDVKIVEQSEIKSCFDHSVTHRLKKSSLLYLIFSLKSGNLQQLRHNFENAKVVEKNINYNKLGKKFILVGFGSNEERMKIFSALNKIKNSASIRCFYPEHLDYKSKEETNTIDSSNTTDDDKNKPSNKEQKSDKIEKEETKINQDQKSKQEIKTSQDQKIKQDQTNKNQTKQDTKIKQEQTQTIEKDQNNKQNQKSKPDQNTKQQPTTSNNQNQKIKTEQNIKQEPITNKQNQININKNQKIKTEQNTKQQPTTSNNQNQKIKTEQNIKLEATPNKQNQISSNQDQIGKPESTVKQEQKSQKDENSYQSKTTNKSKSDQKVTTTANDKTKSDKTAIPTQKVDSSSQQSQASNKTEKVDLKAQKSDTQMQPKKSLGPEYFSPNQSLIYFYFVEKEKARKISPGKQVKLTLFGVKKCKDIQRYKRIPDDPDERGYFTFFGFEKYEETEAAISVIKSKWLSDSPIEIYESTNAYIKHIENPRKSNFGDDDDDDDNQELFLQAINDKKKQQQQQQQNHQQILQLKDEFNDEAHEIKNVKINIYRDVETQNKQFFIFNQLSIPTNVQFEIKTALNRVKTVKNIMRDVVPHNFIYELCTVIFVDSRDQFIENLFKSVLMKYKIGYSDLPYQKTKDKIEYIEFNERLFSEETLENFLHLLNLVYEIKEIKRNIFHVTSIVTMIFFDQSKSEYILDLIEQFLIEEDCLFDYQKYSLKNTIYFKEELILQNKNDFNSIVNEIKSIGINPIKVERDKFLFYRKLINNCCFERFSFICFEQSKDKMNALNHLNAILFAKKNKKNVLKYDPSLSYIKFDPWRFPPEEHYSKDPALFYRNAANCCNCIDYQEKVASIENPIELMYLGFKTKYLMHYYNKWLYTRFTHLNLFPDTIFFKPIENLYYIRFKIQIVKDLNEMLGSDVTNRIVNYQCRCIDFLEIEGLNTFDFIGFISSTDRDYAYNKMIEFDSKNPNILEVQIYNKNLDFDYYQEFDELRSENIISPIYERYPFKFSD